MILFYEFRFPFPYYQFTTYASFEIKWDISLPVTYQYFLLGSICTFHELKCAPESFIESIRILF